MKDKRGFTLTELLAVIVILGIIALIAIPSSFAISNRIKIKLYCTKLETIKKAAELYASDHYDEVNLGMITKVSVKDLVDYGYLKKDKDIKIDGVYVVDPKDNQTPLDDQTFTLKISNSRAKVSYDEEAYYYLCGDNKLKDKKKPNCLYKGESTEWTNEPRTITVSCYDTGSGCKTKDEVLTYKNTQKHDSVRYHIKDWLGNSETCSKNLDVYVDTTDPTYEIKGEASNSNDWSNKRTITVKCIDHDSGCITEDMKFEYGLLASDNEKRNVETDTISFTLEDKAGNKKTVTKEIKIYTDIDNPTCSYSGESTTWSKESRSVQIICNDTMSGCKTASKSITISSSQELQELNFIAEDHAGNQTDCTKNLNIYVDTVKPTIGTISTSGRTTTVTVNDDQVLDYYEVYNSAKTLVYTGTLTGKSKTITYDQNVADTYTLKVFDKAGNGESKTFDIPSYRVTFLSNDPTMGTINDLYIDTNYGENVETTFTLTTGYHFKSVSGTNCTVSGNTIKATNVTGNTTCTVVFEINSYTVSFKVNNTSYGSVANASKTVTHGSSVDTTYSLTTGYHYTNVTGDKCSVSGNKVTASNVTGDMTCTVNLAINVYTVNFVSADTSLGTVNTASANVNHGGNASSGLTIKSGYKIKSVSGTYCSGSGTTVTASNVLGATTCTVSFEIACTFPNGSSKTFDYTGGVQSWPVPCDGTYKIEVWGAQGRKGEGYTPGYGGYAVGTATLSKTATLYVVVGGQGGGTGVYGSSPCQGG